MAGYSPEERAKIDASNLTPEQAHKLYVAKLTELLQPKLIHAQVKTSELSQCLKDGGKFVAGDLTNPNGICIVEVREKARPPPED